VKKISGWNRRGNSQEMQQIISMKKFKYPKVYYAVHTVSNRIITRSLLLSLHSFLVSKREASYSLNISPEFGDLFFFTEFHTPTNALLYILKY